jgi:hypothetical protein
VPSKCYQIDLIKLSPFINIAGELEKSTAAIIKSKLISRAEDFSLFFFGDLVEHF